MITVSGAQKSYPQGVNNSVYNYLVAFTLASGCSAKNVKMS